MRPANAKPRETTPSANVCDAWFDEGQNPADGPVPLQPLVTNRSSPVSRTLTTIDPKHPSRLEKKPNTSDHPGRLDLA